MEYSLWNNSKSSAARASLIVLLLALVAVPVRAQQGVETEELLRRGQAAGVDQALLRAVEERAIETGLSTTQRVQLLEKAVELGEQGLPAEPLLRKTLEGLAKQVPVTRMVPVLDRMQQQTVGAGQIISNWLQRPDVKPLIAESQPGDTRESQVLVVNLAEALLNDVPRSTVDAVLDRLPKEAKRNAFSRSEVGTALGVLADLPTAKADADATAHLLVSALNAGYSEAEIRQLPLAMRAAEQSGVPAAQTAHDVAREMTRGTPAEEVLRSLFSGEFPGLGRGAGIQGGPPTSPGPPPGVGPDDVGGNRGRGGNQGRGDNGI